jgi:hypothetical protein
MRVLFLVLGLSLSQVASAQFLQKIFGSGNPLTPKAKWSCPQQNYPQIAQLRNNADVQVLISEENGELKIEFKPKVFRVNPLSINFVTGLVTKKVNATIDYTDCIKSFQENVKNSIEEIKSSQCTQNPDKTICHTSANEISESIEKQINQEPYFEKNSDSIKIPQILPGKKSSHSLAEIDQAFKLFKETGELNPKILFSLDGISYLNQTNMALNQGQIEKLQITFNSYLDDINESACKVSDSFCETIKNQNDETETTVTTVIKNKLAHLNRNDATLLARAGIPETEEEADKRIKELLEKKPFECNMHTSMFNSNGRQYIATRFPEAIANNLDRFSEVADRDCIERTIQNYAYSFVGVEQNEEEFKKYCENNFTDACLKAQKRREVMDSNIKRLFTMLHGELGYRYVKSKNSCFLDKSNPEQDIFQVISDHRKLLTCIDLKAGEAKVVSHRDGAPSGIGGNYTLRKKENGDHEIVVGIDIVADNFGVKKEDMFERIQQCMTAVSPYMNGPDGTNLDFKILNTDEIKKLPVSEMPRINNVSIQAPGSRSNSASYKADIDCPTITHEVLHLLGLCDEYNGTLDGYTCRAVAAIPSVMSSQNQAFRYGVAQTYDCKCRPGSICERVKNQNNSALADFYMMPSIYSAISYELRNKYCNYTNLPSQNWTEDLIPKSVSVTNKTETTITLVSEEFGDNWPRISRTQFNCKCPANDTECPAVLNEMQKTAENIKDVPRNQCPSGSTWSSPTYGNHIESGRPYEWGEDGIKFVQKPSWPSILHPSHFERIVGGACPSKATKYNECAIWAYRNQYNTNNCEGRPEHCSNGKEFLGVKE